MIDVAVCPECGVPEPFMQGQMWLNNGDIVQRVNANARVAFVECENFDPLFKNIGDIIGISIEPIIVNVAARAYEAYMRRLIPEEVRNMVREGQIEYSVLSEPIISYCHVCGFGKYDLLGYRYERDKDDFYKQRITRPYSVPIAAGALAGALSSVLGGEHKVVYEEVAPDCYEFTTAWTEYPKELMKRFTMAAYEHRDGDLELESCATCGMPRALSAYRWDLEDGLIVNRHTGRRMALVGPESLDQVFKELEKELGETIPDVVVEAQRRFTRTGFYSIDQVSDEGDFRTQLALRGLGNLRQMKIGPGGLSLRIDNATGYLTTVGMVQGLFEMTFDIDSHVEWELVEEGDLLLEITPAAPS
jgi:ribosomal protein L37E